MNVSFEDRVRGAMMGAAIGANLGYARNADPARFAVKTPMDIFSIKLEPLADTALVIDKKMIYSFYCLRGDRENRIKEFKVDLSSGRTSCHKFLANQTRLLLHAAASVLMSALQASLEGTRWATAQVNTLRVRILKVGARVVETCRKIWMHLPTAFPDQDIWRVLHERLAT